MALVRDGETNYLERVRWGGPGQECWRVDQRPLTTNYRSAGPRTQGLDQRLEKLDGCGEGKEREKNRQCEANRKISRKRERERGGC